MNLKDTYNLIAKDWYKDHKKDDWWVAGTDKFTSFLDHNDNILDVGCGAGVKSDCLINKGFKVTGIDFSDQMIELAGQNVTKGNFLVKDIKEPLGFNEQFDGVFAQAVLLHISKQELSQVLKNIIEPLKPGGYFYAAVKEVKPDRPEEGILKENDYGYEYERFFSYYTSEEVVEYITSAGLGVVYQDIISSGKTNWIQIIGQK